MPENNVPSLDRDIAELIRLQKKQLTHQRIRTALSVLVFILLIVLAVAALKLTPEIMKLISESREALTELRETIGDLDLDSLYEEGYEYTPGSIFDFFQGLFY